MKHENTSNLYRKNLPCFNSSNMFYMLIFRWKLDKKNDHGSSLVDYFIKNGATGDQPRNHPPLRSNRKLNNNSYTISELASKYGNAAFKNLVDLTRNVSVGDTVYGNWFNAERYFHHFSYTAWFEVVGKDETTDTLKLKILKLIIGDKSVDELLTTTLHWRVDDVRETEEWRVGE